MNMHKDKTVIWSEAAKKETQTPQDQIYQQTARSVFLWLQTPPVSDHIFFDLYPLSHMGI